MRIFAPLTLGVLLVGNFLIFAQIIQPHGLEVAVLNIGQGDAILVRGPTGITMLIDGGPDASVLRELGATLPFWERRIDAVVVTNPDKDHIGGFPDVFNRYDVSYVLQPGTVNDTKAAEALDAALRAEPDIYSITARRGMRLNLGGGAYADILYPDRDVSKMDSNPGSIVMRVVYGETSFMLTGDLTSEIEDWLLVLDKDDGELPVDVLKAGHHGSKYSTDDAWLAALHPSMVAISVGAHNSYGHPTEETLSRIKNEGATVYRTDQNGRIIFSSNGETVAKR